MFLYMWVCVCVCACLIILLIIEQSQLPYVTTNPIQSTLHEYPILSYPQQTQEKKRRKNKMSVVLWTKEWGIKDDILARTCFGGGDFPPFRRGVVLMIRVSELRGNRK